MSKSSPPRDPFRWTILGLITVSHIIGAAAQYGINTLAPFYQEDLGLSRAQVGLFFSAFYLAMTGASFGAGWLAPKIGIALFSATVTVGTLAGSVLLDHYGAFGADVQRATLVRVVGLMALFLGVVLVRSGR